MVTVCTRKGNCECDIVWCVAFSLPQIDFFDLYGWDIISAYLFLKYLMLKNSKVKSDANFHLREEWIHPKFELNVIHLVVEENKAKVKLGDSFSRVLQRQTYFSVCQGLRVWSHAS